MTPKHLVLAIARANRWFDVQKNPAQWTNNPGALTQAPARFVQIRQRTRGDGLVQFQCGSEGFAALENVLRSSWARGETVAQVVQAHAPLCSPQTVAGWLKVDARSQLRMVVQGDWPVVPRGWKNFPPPGEMPAWPLQASYLDTLGCEEDQPDEDPGERPQRRKKRGFYWGLATVAML